MRDCVVDASVAVKLFISETLSAEADRLFAALKSDSPARFWAPDLFFIECANIFWKHVTRFGYPVDKAKGNLIKLRSLLFHSIPTALLMEEALDIALAQGITAYDACYVALAQRVGVPLVTADQRLTRQLKRSPFEVKWLGDL